MTMEDGVTSMHNPISSTVELRIGENPQGSITLLKVKLSISTADFLFAIMYRRFENAVGQCDLYLDFSFRILRLRSNICSRL